jgi:pimeloyl-ACP methyl ester carboxylesterase
MHHVTSADGTSIAASKVGHGPPLVLVHGTTADHSRFGPILPELMRRFTVYAMDRRGRGESADAPTYAIEREFEDVAALVDSIGEPVFLLGHSYGAICTLEASLLTQGIRKLVLYEPPIPTEDFMYPPGLEGRLSALLEAGDHEGVVSTFFREVVKAPDEEIEQLRSLPSWPARVAAAHTIPREMRVHEAYLFKPESFAAMRVPTALLLGGDSPAMFRTATELVHAALPNSRVVVLPGQQHTAINTAPDLFLREVVAFLDE